MMSFSCTKRIHALFCKLCQHHNIHHQIQSAHDGASFIKTANHTFYIAPVQSALPPPLLLQVVLLFRCSLLTWFELKFKAARMHPSEWNRNVAGAVTAHKQEAYDTEGRMTDKVDHMSHDKKSPYTEPSSH